MLISLQKRFIFVANLKSASTAIERTLRPVSDIALLAPSPIKHQSFRQIETRFDWLFKHIHLRHFFIFGVIRDPIDLMISLYNSHRDDKFSSSLELYTANKTFDDFLSEWLRVNNWQTQCQHERFLDSEGALGVNYAISYDRLNEGLTYVSQSLRFTPLLTLPLDNTSPKFLTRNSLTSSQTQSIKERFAADYEFLDGFCDRLLSDAERRGWPRRKAAHNEVPLHTGDFGATGVTREEVTWAYRLLLDREPESEHAIKGHLSASSRAELRNKFLGSTEYQSTKGISRR